MCVCVCVCVYVCEINTYSSPLSFSLTLASSVHPPSLPLSPVGNRYAESGEEIVLDLSSISDRVKQTSVGSHLYRDNGCNFGSFPVPHLRTLSSPFPLDFTYAYVQIAEADRGGFDCTARDRRFINALSA